MLKGFKDFVLRGNVIDLAVAVVIGAAFSSVVSAVTDKIIKPLLNAITPPSTAGFGPTLVPDKPTTLVDFGAVISSTLNFLIVASVVYFAIVLPMRTLQERRRRGEEAGPVDPTDVELLKEIRDLLKAQAGHTAILAGQDGQPARQPGTDPLNAAGVADEDNEPRLFTQPRQNNASVPGGATPRGAGPDAGLGPPGAHGGDPVSSAATRQLGPVQPGPPRDGPAQSSPAHNGPAAPEPAPGGARTIGGYSVGSVGSVGDWRPRGGPDGGAASNEQLGAPGGAPVGPTQPLGPINRGTGGHPEPGQQRPGTDGPDPRQEDSRGPGGRHSAPRKPEA